MLTPDEQRADFERALAALDAAASGPRASRRDVGRDVADAPSSSPNTACLRLVADGRRPPVHARQRSGHDRRTAGALEPRRLGAVRVPARPAIGGHRVAGQGPRMWTAEIDAMARHRCLFVLTCHPFLSGRASDREPARRIIEFALERGDVGFPPPARVAALAASDARLPTRPLAPGRRGPGRLSRLSVRSGRMARTRRVPVAEAADPRRPPHHDRGRRPPDVDRLLGGRARHAVRVRAAQPRPRRGEPPLLRSGRRPADHDLHQRRAHAGPRAHADRSRLRPPPRVLGLPGDVLAVRGAARRARHRALAASRTAASWTRSTSRTRSGC